MRTGFTPLSVLLAMAGIASSASAQLAQQAKPWGEPVEGVQLRLALATSGAPSLPGELPAMEVQIRNQGRTAVTVNPEAITFADVEIDDVWVEQDIIITGTKKPVAIAPGSQHNFVRTYQNLFANPGDPGRSQLVPGPHRIRLRNLTDESLGVHTADGRQLTLVSNRLDISIPVWSANAEREALAVQTAAGGFDGLAAARRLVERYPDAALPAIEKAIAVTVDQAWRAEYVRLAGTIVKLR